MVKKQYNIETFSFPKNHKKYGVRLLSMDQYAKCINKNNINLSFENTVFSDFEQGCLRNCGVVSGLAAISQRKEFISEIAPTVEHTKEGYKLHFNMFSKGIPTKVTIDDALPFKENNELAYARSLNSNIAFLSAYFEKAFVKLACQKSYSTCVGINSDFIFSSFSDCLVCYRVWFKEEKKTNIIKDIISEIKEKSSITLCFTLPLDEEIEEKTDVGHSYVVIDFDERKNSLKLYEPNCYPPILRCKQKPT